MAMNGRRGQAETESSATHRVKRLTGSATVDADWDKPMWHNVPTIDIARSMGDMPEHPPEVRARLAYDDEAIYVIFRVEDRYVRAVAREHQDAVCLDSCVEFFFTPGTDPAAGYFNLEMNCGGTVLFRYNTAPRKGEPIAPADIDRMRIAHVMPRIVDPEITEPTTWTVEYRLPFGLIAKYCPGAARPGPGVAWRANFYKCADETSHPHWLTWARVDRPRPDFHVPESFGTLVFE